MSDELRRKWKAHFQEHDRRFYAWQESGYVHSMKPKRLPFPKDLKDLTCEAKTRKGTPCKRMDLYSSGRCKLHGGLSTGPKTVEGKRQSALNGSAPKAKPMRPS